MLAVCLACAPFAKYVSLSKKNKILQGAAKMRTSIRGLVPSVVVPSVVVPDKTEGVLATV